MSEKFEITLGQYHESHLGKILEITIGQYHESYLGKILEITIGQILEITLGQYLGSHLGQILERGLGTNITHYLQVRYTPISDFYIGKDLTQYRTRTAEPGAYR